MNDFGPSFEKLGLYSQNRLFAGGGERKRRQEQKKRSFVLFPFLLWYLFGVPWFFAETQPQFSLLQ